MGREPDPAGPREPLVELPQGRRRRADAGAASRARRQLRHGVQHAAKTVVGPFYYPYNGHTPLGPAAAVADYKANGGPDKDTVTVFHNTQNVATTTTEVQAALKLARPNQVRMVFYEGASSFGNGYHYNDISQAGRAALASSPARRCACS